ncbi:MAG: dihydrolipoyl dehydrogenase [Chloroflexota bacterium]
MAVKYDIAIVGGGPGGYVAAIRATQLGAKVAVIEKERLGGTCLNVGCIPTKTIIKSVRVLEEMRRADRFGIEVDHPETIRPNLEKIMARKDAVVNQLVAGVEGLFKAYKIDLYKGRGRLLSPNRVSVETTSGSISPELTELEASNIILATGSAISRLPIPGIDLDGVIDSNTILSLKELPQSLIIIGGGIIGVEWAGIMAPLGTKVTILEALPNILLPVDDEIRQRFQVSLKKLGVVVNTGAKVEAIEPTISRRTEATRGLDPHSQSEKLTVHFSTTKGPQTATAQMVMVAVGRSPYTEGLGLAEIGVNFNRRAVISNERMETNVEHLYAIGDVTQRIMLAHVASAEGEVAVENIMGHSRVMDYRAIPNCIYTNPELASVGPTEQELKATGVRYKVSKFPFSALGRAVTIDETSGIVKLLLSEDKGEILAAHIMGPDATDLIAELVLAVKEQITAEELSQIVHAHPTLSEAIQEAALGGVKGASPIHFKR